jgi:peptide deformylase
MTITKLKVRLYGDPCLRKKSAPVKEVGPAERILIQSMIDTMHQEKGIGLAAPQVGINQRILIVDVGEGPFAVINPDIIHKSGSDVMEEGCLSLPGVTINVKRALKIRVRYLDHQGSKHERNFQDLRARVILHETDHLNGKLITDYANLAEKLKFRSKLKQLEKENTPKS